MQLSDTKRREPKISPIKGRATRVALNVGAQHDQIIVGEREMRQQTTPLPLSFYKRHRRVGPVSCFYLVLGGFS